MTQQKDQESAYPIINLKGEVVDYLYEGDRIVRYSQTEHLRTYIENFNRGENFVKVFDKQSVRLKKELTRVEYVIAMGIIPYISYSDNVLRDKDGKVLDNRDISELLGENYDTTRKTIASLNKKGVLGIHKVGCLDNPNITIKSIIANPYIFTRGNKMKREICGLFINSGWDS